MKVKKGAKLTAKTLTVARLLLIDLQDQIQARLLSARAREGHRFSKVAEVAPEDTIFHVDKISEAVIHAWLKKSWPREWPIKLVAEGIPSGTTFPLATPLANTLWRLILDPIDGTRALMYDKRSAWSLAGLAPQLGSSTSLRDIVVAVMTELPTSKAGWADQLSAVRGGPLRATRRHLASHTVKNWRPRPSTATDCDQGFAAVVKFFPEGKVAAAEIEEALWRKLELHGQGVGARVFDDQYISTGGQLYELIVGHDRMVADLRPILLARAGLSTALSCHPYDICTALLLEAAGGVITTPGGQPLTAPLDLTSPVAWVGFANRALAEKIGPVLKNILST
jgi:fructose-1,6-bisphosphatase/inositol monophosphatase family enzyme